jgi:hypothetical protein
MPAGDIDAASVQITESGCEIKFKVLARSTGGTYNYGLGANNSLTGSEKLRVTVTSVGRNTNGTVSAPTRTVYGTKYYRKTYPNQTQAQEEVSGSDVILWVFLSEPIASEEVVTSVEIAAGFYTQGGNPSNAFSGVSATNLSTRSLSEPRCFFQWTDYPHQLVNSSTYQARAIALQYFATDGLPVASVEFWAVDLTTGAVTPSVFVTTPSYDPTRTVTAYGSGLPYYEYTANLDLTNITQGNKFAVHAKVNPWIGQQLNTNDGVNTEEDADYGPLHQVCNKTGAYQFYGYALVDPTYDGSNGAGQVYSTRAAAIAANRPYTSLHLAAGAIRAYNNGLGLNVYQGEIMCANQAMSFWGGSLSAADTPVTWLKITYNPGVSAGAPRITSIATNQTGPTTMKLMFDGIGFDWSENSSLISQGYKNLLLWNCWAGTNQGSNATIASFFTNFWAFNTTFYGLRRGLTGSIDRPKSFVKLFGCVMPRGSGTTFTTSWSPFTMLGNLIHAPQGEPQQFVFSNDSGVINDGGMWGYNKIVGGDALVYTMKIGIEGHIQKGFAIFRNVLASYQHGAGIPWDIAYSNRTPEYMNNILDFENTWVCVVHPPFVLLNAPASDVYSHWYRMSGCLFGDLEFRGDILGAYSSLGPPYARWEQANFSGCDGNVTSEIGNGDLSPEGTNNLFFGGVGYRYFTNIAAFKFLDNCSAYGTDATKGRSPGDFRLALDSPVGSVRSKRRTPLTLSGKWASVNDPPGAYGWEGQTPQRRTGVARRGR